MLVEIGNRWYDIRERVQHLLQSQSGATTGWASHGDTQYTQASPFSLAANTDAILPNNNGNVLDSQKPLDVTSFYDGSVITGREGDGIAITFNMVAVPTSAAATNLEIWVDIGGSVGQLYRHPVSFPKGQGVERPIAYTVVGYTLNTWQQNGGTVYVRGNGTFDLYNIRYVITRTHKAR